MKASQSCWHCCDGGVQDSVSCRIIETRIGRVKSIRSSEFRIDEYRSRPQRPRRSERSEQVMEPRCDDRTLRSFQLDHLWIGLIGRNPGEDPTFAADHHGHPLANTAIGSDDSDSGDDAIAAGKQIRTD